MTFPNTDKQKIQLTYIGVLKFPTYTGFSFQFLEICNNKKYILGVNTEVLKYFKSKHFFSFKVVKLLMSHPIKDWDNQDDVSKVVT